MRKSDSAKESKPSKGKSGAKAPPLGGLAETEQSIEMPVPYNETRPRMGGSDDEEDGDKTNRPDHAEIETKFPASALAKGEQVNDTASVISGIVGMTPKKEDNEETAQGHFLEQERKRAAGRKKGEYRPILWPQVISVAKEAKTQRTQFLPRFQEMLDTLAGVSSATDWENKEISRIVSSLADYFGYELTYEKNPIRFRWHQGDFECRATIEGERLELYSGAAFPKLVAQVKQLAVQAPLTIDRTI